MIHALITVYHPDASVADNARRIARQADVVHICDNSPVSNLSMFADIRETGAIRYHFFGENLGLSAAFNRILTDPGQGLQDEDFVIFFDQDSAIGENHISGLISVWEQAVTAGIPMGCLGPAYFNTSSGHVEVPRVKEDLTPNAYAVSGVITSSMLSTYDTLRSVGFWNEDVFLDMADWELCWRLMANGRRCCMTEAVVLHHSLGLGEKKIGPLRIRIAHPYREYYQIRECLYLLGKSYTPMRYRIRFLAMVLVRSPIHLIFLDRRKTRFLFMWQGLKDHFRRRRGCLDPQIMNHINGK